MGYLRVNSQNRGMICVRHAPHFQGLTMIMGNERFNRRFRLIRMFTQALSIYLASGSLIKGKAGCD